MKLFFFFFFKRKNPERDAKSKRNVDEEDADQLESDGKLIEEEKIRKGKVKMSFI